MKNCRFSTIFKPASEHSLGNFWSSGSCSNLHSPSCSRFPCNYASVWGSAQAILPDFRTTLEVSDPVHASDLLRTSHSACQKKSVRISNGMFCGFFHCFQIFIRCMFPCNLWIFGQLCAQNCNCSADTELMYRNNRAKNQFNVFFTTVEVNGLLSFFLCSLILLFPGRWWHEKKDDRFRQCWA